MEFKSVVFTNKHTFDKDSMQWVGYASDKFKCVNDITRMIEALSEDWNLLPTDIAVCFSPW